MSNKSILIDGTEGSDLLNGMSLAGDPNPTTISSSVLNDPLGHDRLIAPHRNHMTD